ncbi:hypothetical protein LCGC14_2662400 [marine sediment metagenome]|uniref:Uncharacterized protein n=1 Tax=marine sediment metagenome TaxID=412755 RepID=A0A0F9CII3_9ZZZZ
MTFELVDDGTLDTVVQCSKCGGQERCEDSGASLLPEVDIQMAATMCALRVGNAIVWAEQDHTCKQPEYPACSLCNGPLEVLGKIEGFDKFTRTRCGDCGVQESWPHALEA